jgi:integrase
VRLILLTGARRGEVLGARWDQFDLETAVWIKPAATTKQRRLHRVPISASAAALLRTIRLRVPEDCEWVFPGDAEGKPLQDIKRFWEDVRSKAELPAVRIHDLRNTFASLLVSSGMTLPMIGKLLGHTQVQTTQRYAHLLDDPLRAGLEQVGDMLRAKPRPVQTENHESHELFCLFIPRNHDAHLYKASMYCLIASNLNRGTISLQLSVVDSRTA